MKHFPRSELSHFSPECALADGRAKTLHTILLLPPNLVCSEGWNHCRDYASVGNIVGAPSNRGPFESPELLVGGLAMPCFAVG